MKDLITIFIPTKPVPKGRPRAVRMGDSVRAYTPKRTRSFESRIAYVLAERYDRPPAKGPLDVTMAIALPVPASWPAYKRDAALAGTLLPTMRPDVENVAKSVLDACNGILWTDDSEVIELRVRKLYTPRPGIWLRVRNIDGTRAQDGTRANLTGVMPSANLTADGRVSK